MVVVAFGPANVSSFLFVAFPVFVTVLGLGGRLILERVKRRITYPRTGMVIPRRPRRWQSVLSFVVSLGLCVLVLMGPLSPSEQLLYAVARWLPLLAAVFLSACWMASYSRTRLPRHWYLMLAVLLIGVVLRAVSLGRAAPLFESTVFDLASFFGAVGVMFSIVGGATLRRYLRTAPPAQGGDDE